MAIALAMACVAIPAAAGARVVASATAVKQKSKTCGQTGACSATLSSEAPPVAQVCPSCTPAPPQPYSSFYVDAKPRSTRHLESGSKLIAKLDPGRRLVCPGYTRKDKSWFEFMLLARTRIGITYEIKDTIHNAEPAGLHVCAGLPYRFKTFSGKPAHHRRLPDGKLGFVGLLPDCRTDSAGAVISTGPCVVSMRETMRSGEVSTTVTAQVPSTSQTDPWIGG